MATMKKDEKIILSMACYQDGKLVQREQLGKKKLLIGRFENADICISHPTVSHYHAFIVLDENNGGTIRDLASENGISVNDEMGSELYFNIGDCISIGAVKFYVEETVAQAAIIDKDSDIKVISKTLPEMDHQLAPKKGLEIIDGEYCDITFDEEKFSPSQTRNPLLNTVDLAPDHYIDVEENKSIRANLIQPVSHQSIEVSFLSGGNILSIYYLPQKDGKYFACGKMRKSRRCLFLDGMLTDKKIPFVEIANGEVSIHDISNYFIDEIGAEDSNQWQRLVSDDIVIFTIGTLQIYIRQAIAPAKHKNIPFFTIERDMAKQLLITFVPLFLLATTLLLVDTTPPQEEQKKIAVIYRKAVEADTTADDKSKLVADKVDQNSGVKQEQQKETMPQFSASSSTQQKQQEAPPKASASSTPKPAKVKPYEFKSDKLSAVFGSKAGTPNLNAAKDTSSLSSESLSANVSEVSTKTANAVGTMGKDSYGDSAQSYGAQGLSSKKGVNTAYVAPKTVILGSMDPELLRKILREYLPQFKHCYQQELDLHSDNIKGVVNLDFRIGQDGLVKTAKVEGSKAQFSEKGEECMRSVLRRIAFPKPKGGGVVDVRQPLNFFSERTKM